MHWIILTSIQNSKHLSEKFMATSRATLPVTDGYYFCDVLYKSLINKLLDQLPFTNRFCMKYKIYDFLLADSGYLATAVWVPEKNRMFQTKAKGSEALRHVSSSKMLKTFGNLFAGDSRSTSLVEVLAVDAWASPESRIKENICRLCANE